MRWVKGVGRIPWGYWDLRISLGTAWGNVTGLVLEVSDMEGMMWWRDDVSRTSIGVIYTWWCNKGSGTPIGAIYV